MVGAANPGEAEKAFAKPSPLPSLAFLVTRPLPSLTLSPRSGKAPKGTA